MKNKLLLFLLIIFSSCVNNATSDMDKNTAEVIRFKNDYISLTDSLKFDYIPLETTEQCLIGSIAEIKIKGDNMYVLEGKKSEDLFVFDLSGKFIAKVGESGNGPEQYIQISGFDIDESTNSIVISDKHRSRILFYDLDTYAFKKAITVNSYYNNFICNSNEEMLFFACNGFHNQADANDEQAYYLQVTDMNLSQKTVGLPGDFMTPYTSVVYPGKSHLYKYRGDVFVYHHLFPSIYQYKNGKIEPKYHLELDGYAFPEAKYLKENGTSGSKNKNYDEPLTKSNYLTAYRVDECASIIHLSCQKNNMPIQAIYNKRQKKGYLFTLKDYFRSMNLGMLMFPAGATDNQINGVRVRLEKAQAYKDIRIDERHCYLLHDESCDTLMSIYSIKDFNEEKIITRSEQSVTHEPLAFSNEATKDKSGFYLIGGQNVLFQFNNKALELKETSKLLPFPTQHCNLFSYSDSYQVIASSSQKSFQSPCYYSINQNKSRWVNPDTIIRKQLKRDKILCINQCCANQDKERFVVAYRFLNYVSFYDWAGVLKHTCRFGETLEQENMNLYSPSITKYFVDIYGTDKFVYCLYSGSLDMKSNSKVLKFDWNGKLIDTYQLDCSTYAFAVTDDNTQLYSLSSDESGSYALFRFKL